jgi:acyl carrier protein
MNTQVLRILSKIQPDFDFSQDLNFIEEGMIDSFDMINLVTELDEEFGISIDGVDIIPENFSTISAIVLLLNKSGIR